MRTGMTLGPGMREESRQGVIPNMRRGGGLSLKAQASLMALIISAGTISSVHAVQTQAMDESKRLEFRLSAHELNRLSIKGGLIATWTCTEGTLEEEVDEAHGQIFIRPHVKEGVIYGTVTTDQGVIQDLAFRISKGAPESIVLVPQDQGPKPQGAQKAPGMDLSGAPSSVHQSAVLLVSRLLKGEGTKASHKRVRPLEKGLFAPSLRCVRTLQGAGLEAQLFVGTDPKALENVRAWGQQGDIALGLYGDRLVVVRRAS